MGWPRIKWRRHPRAPPENLSVPSPDRMHHPFRLPLLGRYCGRCPLPPVHARPVEPTRDPADPDDEWQTRHAIVRGTRARLAAARTTAANDRYLGCPSDPAGAAPAHRRIDRHPPVRGARPHCATPDGGTRCRRGGAGRHQAMAHPRHPDRDRAHRGRTMGRPVPVRGGNGRAVRGSLCRIGETRRAGTSRRA